jgi:hypothetical protein
MENQTKTLRRPIGLWVLVGLYSAMVLLSFGTAIYLRYFSSFSARLQDRHADWTVLDYVFVYYPGILVLLGCVGLVMLRRWAVYPFALLLGARLRDLVLALLREWDPDVPEMMVWFPHTVHPALAAIAFFYALHLWRNGTLRKGV